MPFPTTYGSTTFWQGGRGVSVSADGMPLRKEGGVTIDWSTVTAVNADTTLPDGRVVKNGDKYLQFGTILCREVPGEVQTVTITGAPTGGTFTLSITVGGVTQTTTALAYNANPWDIEDALALLPLIGPNNVDVTGAAGGPWTLTFELGQGNEPQLTATASLTGGTTPAVAVATTTSGTATSGMFGPYSSGASNGQQLLNRGDCYILDHTVVYSELGSSNPPVIYGGLCWLNRILNAPGAPTKSQVLTAFPDLAPVNEQ